jgi:hypothetical protein
VLRYMHEGNSSATLIFLFIIYFTKKDKNVQILSCIMLFLLYMVLYGCETWSLILTEEHRLRVFENKVLRRIFGPKRDDVTGG